MAQVKVQNFETVSRNLSNKDLKEITIQLKIIEMKYTTIHIEGAILSADILDKIERGDVGGQLAGDFGFDTKIRVKDEIARAWADAQDLWRIFKRQKKKVAEQEYGTTETRKFWMIPLLGLLGYDAQLSKAKILHGKSYAVSHCVTNLDGFPIHIVGFNDSLDKKRTDSGPRMSPHALLQEYINLPNIFMQLSQTVFI